MNTLILPASHPEAAQTAARLIREGELVAIPTETVYGLGANGLSETAVPKIFAAKGRPNDNPLILHVWDASQVDELCHSIPDAARALMAAFWPGPLTIVLPAKPCVPKCTTAGLSTVAVRCPDNAVTREIIRLAGVPIAAPSANLSGKPSTTTAEHVYHDHAGKIPLIIDGGACAVGVESTIIDMTDTTPRLLRPGGISPEELYAVIGECIIDKAVTSAVDQDEIVKAPGMKYRHYAPDCQVIIVEGDLPAAKQYISSHWQPGNRVLCFEEELPFFADFAPLAYGRQDDIDSLLAGLFAALRQLDDPTIGTVFAREPQGSGRALAVQNRLGKAAGFRRVNPRKQHCILGITGGSGCGKTTLLDTVKKLGGRVIDCDAVYHRLLREDAGLLAAIEARFPGVVENGALNRKKLGTIVFADPAALKDLNGITHAAVKQEVFRLIPPVPSLVAIDAIGLFEGGLAELCDVTVAVTAPEEDRIRRLMARDGISEEYARSRIRAQKSNEEFSRICSETLENNGTVSDFQGKCLAILLRCGIMKP